MEVVTRLGWRLVALAAGSIAAGSVTAALQDEQPPGAVEEIVVTAQKREQSAVEVPIAVTAFDATRIEALRIDDLETIGDFTPGLEINPGENESSPIFSIRGVGSNNVFSNNNPAVAVHLDEIYLFSNALLGVPLFDLERIEVLKGPQGTLYGRNATAGAINFVTRKPDEEESGYVRVEYGRYDALELRAAYGGAIAESVSARLALYAKTRDGYQNAVSNVGISDGFTSDPDNIPPIPAVAAEDGANESNENAARASLSWSPSHRARVLLTMHVGGTNGMATQDRIRTADPTGFAPPPADIYTVFNNTRDPFESRFTGGALRAELDLDVASITSITGYEQLDRNFGRPDGSPFRITDTTRSEDLRTLTQELRVSSLGPDAPLYWLVGAYYSDDEIDFLNDLDATDLLASVVRTDFVETGRSAALFGQLEWRLATAWKATAGLRFTNVV